MLFAPAAPLTDNEFLVLYTISLHCLYKDIEHV